jgi:hypothetical protein
MIIVRKNKTKGLIFFFFEEIVVAVAVWKTEFRLRVRFRLVAEVGR